MKKIIKSWIQSSVDFIADRKVVTSIEKSQKGIAFKDSQRFIYENSCLGTLTFSSHVSLREHCVLNAPKNGLLLEFGVYKGKSINFMASVLDRLEDERLIYGFDSFEGFSEEWSGVDRRYQKKHFDQSGKLPAVNARVRLVPGFIEDTLPSFVADVGNDAIAFVHIDTDTYTPAFTILSQLQGKFVAGTIVLFDEYCGYPNWRSHEHAALTEVVERDRYEFIGFAQSQSGANLVKAAIRIN